MALWILSGTTRVSQYQKGKTNLDLLEQEIVSGSGNSCAICKSAAPHPRDITMSASYQSVSLQAGCPSGRPTNSVKALICFHDMFSSHTSLVVSYSTSQTLFWSKGIHVHVIYLLWHLFHFILSYNGVFQRQTKITSFKPELRLRRRLL